MKPSWCPNPNAVLIWDVTAEIELEECDDESLHDLAAIHLKEKKQCGVNHRTVGGSFPK